MSSVIETIERAQLRRVPTFASGDRVKVHFQVIEGSRRRVQVFEGVVIKRQGHGARETFTVRKQSFGVGVERTFPVHSPKIERIELAARGDVRRAKLYYLRERIGKRARVRERRYSGPEQIVEPGLLHEPTEATDAEGMTAEETVAEAAEASVAADAGEATVPSEAGDANASTEATEASGETEAGEANASAEATEASGAADGGESAEPAEATEASGAAEEKLLTDADADDAPDGSQDAHADSDVPQEVGEAEGDAPAADAPDAPA